MSKKSWSTPQLVVYGTATQITKQGGGFKALGEPNDHFIAGTVAYTCSGPCP